MVPSYPVRSASAPGTRHPTPRSHRRLATSRRIARVELRIAMGDDAGRARLGAVEARRAVLEDAPHHRVGGVARGRTGLEETGLPRAVAVPAVAGGTGAGQRLAAGLRALEDRAR